MGVLIFCAMPSDTFAILLWIYICHVSDVQRRNVLIVESLYTIIFSFIDPPDQSECAPIMLGQIPLSHSLRFFVAFLNTLTMSPLVSSIHALLRQTLQSILSSIALLLRMCYTLRARAATAPLLPVDLWCKVFPNIPFF